MGWVWGLRKWVYCTYIGAIFKQLSEGKVVKRAFLVSKQLLHLPTHSENNQETSFLCTEKNHPLNSYSFTIKTMILTTNQLESSTERRFLSNFLNEWVEDNVPQGEIIVGFKLIGTIEISKSTSQVPQFSLHIASYSANIKTFKYQLIDEYNDPQNR